MGEGEEEGACKDDWVAQYHTTFESVKLVFASKQSGLKVHTLNHYTSEDYDDLCLQDASVGESWIDSTMAFTNSLNK